ncbi:coiled-coil domain-containing protein [Herbiconiux liangxiaofengii]|uniref:coiled-coil domain-containing protein n=1 Tax=Herbiconiux liangxiaofengii TaxID=3342795 RepID=UPI0035BB73EB
MWKPSVRGWGTLAVVTALVLGSGVPAGAAPQMSPATAPGTTVPADDDFPTWDEVNAAKANEQAAAAKVTEIQADLDSLDTVLAERTDAALKSGQEYLKAKSSAEAAATYAATLQQQADDATSTADRATAQAGLIAAQLYRSGGDPTMNLVLNQNNSSSLLYQLGAMAKLTEQTSRIKDAAEAAKNTASALEEQAQIAKTERDTLEQTAQDELQAAKDAKAETDAEIASQTAIRSQMVDQLASLKNTTAQVEKAYQDGQAQLAAQRAAEAAAAAAAAGSGDYDDTPGSAWVPGSGEVASPAVAQAFAQSILGDYGWGGDQFSCLVRLWTGESGWRANAYNDSSGAYGIPQSLPASKMASVGSDYVTNHQTQIIWGMNYISGRYGTPCEALSQWTARNPHWY